MTELNNPKQDVSENKLNENKQRENMPTEKLAENKQSENKPAENKPRYTKGEEIFNAVSHIVGGAFGIVALVLGVIFAVIRSDGFGVVGMAIYGASLIIMYTMSSIYHFLRPNKAKRVFRILDHCAIFLLIAGTYTPICLTVLRNEAAWGWVLFGLVWLFAIIGVSLNATIMEKVKIFSMICYIGMGWCVVIAVYPLINAFHHIGCIWLLLGGIAYTFGAVLYGVAGRKKIKYLHSVWHLFILLGSALQYVAILGYAL